MLKTENSWLTEYLVQIVSTWARLPYPQKCFWHKSIIRSVCHVNYLSLISLNCRKKIMGACDAIATLFWSLIWLICLLIAIPIGLICAVVYVILSPLSVCCSCCTSITDTFHKGLDLPRSMASNMMDGKKGCWDKSWAMFRPK